MIKEAIAKLVEKKNLTHEECLGVFNEIMSGTAEQSQIGAFLTALAIKGETPAEITASAEVMREKCDRFLAPCDVLEIVGTGGDRSYSFNVSTTSCFICAAAGVKTAKHGNTSVSSKTGASDMLEALGADIRLPKEKSLELLERTNMCFLFAQKYHSAMRFVGPVRKAIGIRTVFNIVGPLTNPAFPKYQLLGVFSESLVRPLAEVLINLGVERGMVVYGDACYDELTTASANTVAEINNGEITEYKFDPLDIGMARCDKKDLEGADAAANAQITRDILNGKILGAKRDTVLLNAGAALYITGKAPDIEAGVKLAAEMIDSGKAAAKLEEFVRVNRELSAK